MAGPGNGGPGIPSLARIRSCASQGYLARIGFWPARCRNQSGGRLNPVRVVGRASTGSCQATIGRPSFFVHTDPADSRNVESQRALLQECGLVATALLNPNVSTNQYDMYRLMSFS